MVLVSVGLILFGLLYKPQPKMPDEGMFGEGEGYTEEGGFAGDAAVAIG